MQVVVWDMGTYTNTGDHRCLGQMDRHIHSTIYGLYVSQYKPDKADTTMWCLETPSQHLTRYGHQV